MTRNDSDNINGAPLDGGESSARRIGDGVAIGLAIFIAVDFAILIVISVAAAPAQAPAIVIGFVALTAGTAWLFQWLCWRPWAKRFPVKPMTSEAVVRRWQSIALSKLGRFNHCVHIGVDERHLHVIPSAPLRWLGARTISLPWERIGEVRRSRFGPLHWARVGGRAIAAPGWCLRLAEPRPSEEHHPKASSTKVVSSSAAVEKGGRAWA